MPSSQPQTNLRKISGVIFTGVMPRNAHGARGG